MQIQVNTDHHVKGGVLIVKNALGESILEPLRNEEVLAFKLPTSYTQKAGPCQWEYICTRIPLIHVGLSTYSIA